MARSHKVDESQIVERMILATIRNDSTAFIDAAVKLLVTGETGDAKPSPDATIRVLHLLATVAARELVENVRNKAEAEGDIRTAERLMREHISEYTKGKR